MSWQKIIFRGVTVTVIAAGFIGGWFTFHYATARQDSDSSQQSSLQEVQETKDRVSLPEAKRTVANIQTQLAEMRALPETRVIPGRIQYDGRRHIKILAATPGILVDVRVNPGDPVAKDQPLAIISSPVLGESRADVLKRKAEWEIAERKRVRESEIETNLKPFVAAIQKRVDIKELQNQFQSSKLGEYREKLMSAYARLLLAELNLKNADPVANSGVLAGRTLQERATERQAADAALLSACEHANFDAEQRRDLAAMTAKDAGHRANIARQHLQTLLGYDPDTNVQEASSDSHDDLSKAEIRAPFAGSIEQRNYSAWERVEAGDELFVLADTSTLWVVVDVREQDWVAIGVRPEKTIEIHVPAIPEKTFSAKVLFVGREVSPTTNAVSIVAEIENAGGILKPGLFVHATVTLGNTAPLLVVPASAISVHEQKTFVFIPDGENRFRRVDITCGRQTYDWVEILAGLKAGDPVVSHGTFLLKSELLLEPEE